MKSPDVALVGYADLDSFTGESFTSLATYLDQRGVLSQLLFRGGSTPREWGAELTPAIPGRSMAPKALAGANRFIVPFHDRYYSEELFDVFASRRLNTNVDAVIHFTPGHGRLKGVCEQHDIPMVMVAGIEHTRTSIWRDVQERRSLGLNLHISKTRAKMADRRHELAMASDHVAAMSSFAGESYTNAGIPAENVSTAPIAVDETRYPVETDRDNGGFTASFVGTVTHLKGIHHLLDAWERLEWGTDETAKLDLCGNVDPVFKPHLDSFSANNVTFHGWVDPLKYYQRSSVFVFPTISDGFGKAPLEAMATGTPVIVSDRCGIPDIITDGVEGYVIPAGDVGALANRLLRLREDRDKREKMGRAAAETAAEQSWSEYGESVERVVHSSL